MERITWSYTLDVDLPGACTGDKFTVVYLKIFEGDGLSIVMIFRLRELCCLAHFLVSGEELPVILALSLIIN